jgi:cytochrome o ubiquinol oxidase subunit I
VQLAVSIRDREVLRDVTGDPWDGRTLEWSVASPPPFYNFAETPLVHGRDAWWDEKQEGRAHKGLPVYRRIHMPRNTSTGVIVSAFAAALGFALIWHVWWLAIGCFAAAVVVAIMHSFDENRDYYVPPEQVESTERTHLKELVKA